MRIIDCVQGGPEWVRHRLGIPTCSNFKRIVTATGKRSTQDTDYLGLLLAEWFLGAPVESFSTDWTKRGSAEEDRAEGWWQFETELTPEKVGFCLRDDGLVGGSPDRFVGADGGLEIKVPKIETHMSYVMEPESLKAEYFCQVQGLLWLTGRKWFELVSWHEVLPKVRARCEPDEEYFAALDERMPPFLKRLTDAKIKLGKEKAARDAAMAEAMETDSTIF